MSYSIYCLFDPVGLSDIDNAPQDFPVLFDLASYPGSRNYRIDGAAFGWIKPSLRPESRKMREEQSFFAECEKLRQLGHLWTISADPSDDPSDTLESKIPDQLASYIRYGDDE